MFNVLLPRTKYAIPLYTNTSEVVVCIYGSAIERFYYKQGNGTEMVFFQIQVRRKSMKMVNKQVKILLNI